MSSIFAFVYFFFHDPLYTKAFQTIVFSCEWLYKTGIKPFVFNCNLTTIDKKKKKKRFEKVSLFLFIYIYSYFQLKKKKKSEHQFHSLLHINTITFCLIFSRNFNLKILHSFVVGFLKLVFVEIVIDFS